MSKIIAQSNIPSHIAIVMDGNRRWARKRGLSESRGHEAGVEALEKIVEAASKLGIKTLTVYALSTENISQRARREIAGIFNLMKEGYKTKLKKMMNNGVRVTVLGEVEGLPETIKRIIGKIKNTHIKSESIRVNIALNYGGKREIIEAIKGIIGQGVDVDKLDEKIIERHLYTNGQPDPELVIRTGGRSRLSNFLIWQTAYSELYFTKTLWPDFDREDLKKAISWYQAQRRNFGK